MWISLLFVPTALEYCVFIFSLSACGMFFMTEVSRPCKEVHNRNPGRSVAAWVGTALAIVSLEVLLTLPLL